MSPTPIYGKDITIGTSFRSDAVTVTESHVVMFAGMTGDMNPLHMNRHWAENEGPFGVRIAHGMLVLSLATGLRCPLDDLALVAFLGIESWRFRRPIALGDTVRCHMTLADLRRTSKAGRSVLRVEVAIENQRDEVVQEGSWTMLVLDEEAKG